jgi:hypothetical protein
MAARVVASELMAALRAGDRGAWVTLVLSAAVGAHSHALYYTPMRRAARCGAALAAPPRRARREASFPRAGVECARAALGFLPLHRSRPCADRASLPQPERW